MSAPHPAGRLAGRRILVTGAASGMGAAIARLFAAEGAELALFDRQADGLARVGTAMGHAVFVLDVADQSAVVESVAAAAAQLGGLDGVVNAAGVLVEAPIAETDPATFDKVVGVNLAGPFFVCQASLPHLRANPSATIVNIASMSAVRPVKNMGIYSATKAGLWALSHVMAQEWGPEIRVNTINPGLIRTGMTEHMFDEPTRSARILTSRALGRPGEPREVAELALFLTGPESSFLSATSVDINGGSA